MKIGFKTRHLFAVLLCASSFAPAALAETAQVKFVGAGSNGYWGDEYVGPYDLQLNNLPAIVKAMCDDFLSVVYVGQTWNANVFNVGTLTSENTLASTKWGAKGATQQQYNMAAWLTIQGMDANGASTAGPIQYAIWKIFTDKAYDNLNVTEIAAADEWIKKAKAFENSTFDNVFVLTYSGGAANCPGGPCTRSPQEMLIVKTPEPGVVALLAIDFGAVIALAVYLRRRRAAAV